ncbi:MAG: SpoIIE family protein phosphatase [Candidatus Latescibacteria bacterium]|nr:SpoIIE family protein phosphatase [bacterium]MBD3425072.1 SpoIIE family protein phosphatase [Candidatus Latescibacterota bacterium]
MTDREEGRFVTFRNIPGDRNSISHNQVRSIYEDSGGMIWIGTNGGGLNRFDRVTGNFTRYRSDPEDSSTISNDFVRVIYEDSRGGFWLGTQGGGLNRFDRETGRTVRYTTESGGQYSINSNFVFSIYEDSGGIFWLGTWGGGLNRFEPRTGRFTAFTEEDGLASNSIYGVMEDRNGKLWMSTNNGLSRFDPETGEFKNYNERDGLQSNEFNGGSYFESDQGEMFFGGINGFNSFYPAQIRDNTFEPNIVITSLKIMNREVPLQKYISGRNHITLSHRDYIFSFEFAALEYSAPEKNMYAYRMEGLNDEWIYTDYRKRFANFTTLPPGEYNFRVKGSNNDGVWNERGISLGITITPPLYQRNSFRAAIFLLAVVLAVIWYRRRVRNVRMAAELETAHRAQMSIMPQSPPVVEGFDISGKCIPANEVGGDFFDYMQIGDNGSKLAVVVGDVSGKAMQAAMIAVMSSGMMNAALNQESAPKDAMTSINRSIYKKTGDTMFTALSLFTIDLPNRRAVFSCAGMKPPILKSKGGISVLNRKGCGFPLGAFPDSCYDEDEISLEKDDVLAIFSDGVIEARNRSGQFYGDSRLKTFLESLDTESISSERIRDRILEDIRIFTENRQQEDDITIVVIKVV